MWYSRLLLLLLFFWGGMFYKVVLTFDSMDGTLRKTVEEYFFVRSCLLYVEPGGSN